MDNLEKFEIDKLKTPIHQSPFFKDVLNQRKVDLKYVDLAEQMNEKGYIIVDLKLEEKFIKDINTKIDLLVNEEAKKTNSTLFSYNESPRIVDAGKTVKEVAELACNKEIKLILENLWGLTPIPFSTINFIRGTEQPLHSDTIHFGTVPKGFIAASWVALEEVNESNGGIVVVEGSHRWKDVDFADLGIQPASNMKVSEKNYRLYEDYVRKLVARNEDGLIKCIKLKPGEAIIWAANLLHGGNPINSKNRTRKSQVTHFSFNGIDKNFHPFYSQPWKGKYIERDISNLNIANYLNSKY